MRRFARFMQHFLVSEDGPTSVEYAVMLALIITVCVATIGTLGLNTKAVCDTICTVVFGS
jgi:pilus assembly protein Flp/PilA